MAHEMTENDTAVYYRERAWHNLGTVVPDSMSIMDAYDKSGLGWEVYKTEEIEVNGISTKRFNGVVRADTEEVLGIVSPKYKVVQNDEIFDLAQYFSSVATVESAGSIQGGRKNYLLLHSDSFRATHNDPMQNYMALFWGHDGTSSITVKPTSIRVVCKNTMDMVLAQTTESLTIKHHGDISTKLDQARDIITKYKDTGCLFKAQVQGLANRSISHDELRSFFYAAYTKFWEPIPHNPVNEKEEEVYKKAVAAILTWEDTFEKETLEISASPWVAVNAVTNYIQHRKAERGRQATPESRAYTNLIGSSAKSSKSIMQYAMKEFA